MIGRSAFYKCSNLVSAALPNGLEKVELSAFEESGLESVEFPASLRTISQESFKWCKSLKTVKFSDGLEVLGTDEHSDYGGMLCGVFEGSSVEQIELPTTLKRIKYSTFKNCENLKSITLPDSLECIEEECF